MTERLRLTEMELARVKRARARIDAAHATLFTVGAGLTAMVPEDGAQLLPEHTNLSSAAAKVAAAAWLLNQAYDLLRSERLAHGPR